MLKLKTFIILIIIYIISILSLKTNINLLYPFYLIKDIIYFPLNTKAEEINYSNEFINGINLELIEQINELKNINNISNTLTEFNSINSMVIGRNKMYWFNSLTINSGSDDGITEDLAVVSSKGLIGRISNVSKTTSEVKLLTTNDINFKISVMIKTEDDTIYGIMSGYDSLNNYLKVTSTNKLNEIKKDSLVYTSGLGGVFPSGIIIGKVDTIESDKYDVGRVINVIPSSDNNFKFVSVLKRK